MRNKIQDMLRNSSDFADAFDQLSKAYQAAAQHKEDFAIEVMAVLAFEVVTRKRIADRADA